MVATKVSLQQHKHAYLARFFAEKVEGIAIIALTPIFLKINVQPLLQPF